MKTVVIGGGFSGLATSALLAKDGYKVTLIEKNKQLGGRARKYQEKGFTFDMGPSWYMMPEVFEKYFQKLDRDINDYLDLKQLDVHYKVFFDKNQTYTIKKHLEKNIKLFDKTQEGGGKALKKYLKKSREIYNIATKDLIKSDYKSLTPLLKPKLFRDLPKLNLFKTFHNYVSKYFSNQDLQKIVEFTTVFLGGSPYNTPAFYTLITHADLNLGIYYPMGGIHEIIKALTKVNKELGVEIKTAESVEKIELNKKQKFKAKPSVKSVKTDKSTYETDIVVNTADYQFAETNFLPKKFQTYPAKYWQKSTMSPCAFNIYLGLDKKIKKLEHHNLYFDKSWDKHFKNVYNNPTWPKNPSFYVHVPSRTDPSVAPEGKDALFILVPVAPGLQDDNQIRNEFSDRVIKKLEDIVGEEIKNHIEVQKIFSHRNFQNSYNAYEGAAFGLAHTLFQTAMFRPRNYSKKVQNLYHAGQYTNPGVGMPIALISAEIVRKMIAKNS